MVWFLSAATTACHVGAKHPQTKGVCEYQVYKVAVAAVVSLTCSHRIAYAGVYGSAKTQWQHVPAAAAAAAAA
jgi:hypothetical protein